jgi:hypothetical protein
MRSDPLLARVGRDVGSFHFVARSRSDAATRARVICNRIKEITAKKKAPETSPSRKPFSKSRS